MNLFTKKHCSLLILILTSASSHPVAFAQSDAHFGHYAEERAAGDLAADQVREEFRLSTCKTSLVHFCPSLNLNSITTPESCTLAQISCHAPVTSVNHRFISKYGRGALSANREVLPSVNKIFNLLAETHEIFSHAGARLPLSVRSRVAYVSQVTGLTSAQVESKLTHFFKELSEKPLPSIELDYWGYFQQSKPLKDEFLRNEEGLSKITLAFRWCGIKFRFVDESKTIVGNFLALAISDQPDTLKLPGAHSYELACEKLDSWYPN